MFTVTPCFPFCPQTQILMDTTLCLAAVPFPDHLFLPFSLSLSATSVSVIQYVPCDLTHKSLPLNPYYWLLHFYPPFFAFFSCIHSFLSQLDMLQPIHWTIYPAYPHTHTLTLLCMFCTALILYRFYSFALSLCSSHALLGMPQLNKKSSPQQSLHSLVNSCWLTLCSCLLTISTCSACISLFSLLGLQCDRRIMPTFFFYPEKKPTLAHVLAFYRLSMHLVSYFPPSVFAIHSFLPVLQPFLLCCRYRG